MWLRNNDDEIAREIRDHLDLEAEDRMSDGLAAGEAQRAARLAFGNVTIVEEDVRGVCRITGIHAFAQDLRFATRLLRKHPAFTAVVALTLALGIGATTAAFSAVHGMLLRPLPYPRAEQLVTVWRFNPTQGEKSLVSYPEYVAWMTARSFESLDAATWGWEWSSPTLTGYAPARSVAVTAVTDGLFSLLQVQPILGRTFAPPDTTGGCHLVLSHAFWSSVLGGDRTILGASLTLDDKPCTVLGVMPPSFTFFPRETDVWSVIARGAQPAAESLYVAVYGRVKEGVSRGQAEAELRSISAGLNPVGTPAGALVPAVFGLQDEFTWLAGRDLRSSLWLLFGGVGLLLIIACLNIASLLSARAWSRQREIAMRAALGASRGRLVRQLITEGIVIGVLGATGGVLVALLLLRMLRNAPFELPVGADISMSVPALFFALVCTVGTSIGIGLGPAFTLLRRRGTAALRVREQTHDLAANRFSRVMLAAQTAIAVVLAIAATLLAASALRLENADHGFRVSGLSVATVRVPPERYRDASARVDVYCRLADSVDAVPGVRAVAFANSAPPRSYRAGAALIVSGRPTPDGSARRDVVPLVISESYFDVADLRILAGRSFDRRDQLDTVPVAIVNDVLRRRYFQGDDPIGQRIRLTSSSPWRTIVGIVSNEKENAEIGVPGWVEPPAMFTALAQNTRPLQMSILVQADDSVAPAMSELQRAVAEVDGTISLGELRAMEDRLATVMAFPRFRATLSAAFAAVAVLLMAIGAYGMLAQFVAQRMRDATIRLVLGARPATVARVLTVHAGLPIAVGVGLGITGSMALTGTMTPFLYGIEPSDPFVFAAVSAVVGAAMCVAFWKPIRAILRVEPAAILRAD